MRTRLQIIVLCLSLAAAIGCKKGENHNPAPDSLAVALPPATRADTLSVYPTSGTAGMAVVIRGAHFGSSPTAVSVFFNGVAAAVRAVADTVIFAVVPVTSSGKVWVTVGSRTITGPDFSYYTPITLTGLTPSSGTAGTTVTITGTNFGTVVAAVNVLFNGVPAKVLSVSPTELRVEAPVAANGAVRVSVGGQTLVGPTFAYTTFFTSPYAGGDVQLTTQAEVEAFAAQNKGRTIDISGSLTISGTDITSLSGLSFVNSVTGVLRVNCPALAEVSLSGLTSAGGMYLNNLNATAISMDKVTAITSILSIMSCKNLTSVSFKALKSITGNGIIAGLTISQCPQLSDIDLSALATLSNRLNLTGTAITDLSKFSSLSTAGALVLSGDPFLTSLHGLERLTALTLPAVQPSFTSAIINGLTLNGNAKLRSLDGLQNLATVPLIRITGQPELEGFCPLKTQIGRLATVPDYTYRGMTTTTDVYRTVYVPALTLTGNGSYAATPDALAAVALCN